MTYRSGVVTGLLAAIILAGAVAAGWWLIAGKPFESTKSTPPPVPAKVEKVTANELTFNAITLTTDAEAKLAMRTGSVERKSVRRRRVYGGEVVIPPGRAIFVTAPLSGKLMAPSDGSPAAGQTISRGKQVFRLLPLLDPVGRANLTTALVDAEGKLDAATTQLANAKIDLDRAKARLKIETGTAQMVEAAQAAFDLATKGLEAARANRDQLKKVAGDAQSGTAEPLMIDSPQDGLLRTMSALPGQTVPAGAPLFEVIDLTAMWVRVPVYAGDLPDLDPASPAVIGNLAVRPADPTRPGTPVAAPPTANAIAGTVDLYFAIDNREPAARMIAAGVGGGTLLVGSDGVYGPSLRVGVALPLRDPIDGPTLPRSAIVYDIHGGAWVYEKTADHTYARRRVIVSYTAGDTAILTGGPAVGTAIVVAGAAELFGTETGFSK